MPETSRGSHAYFWVLVIGFGVGWLLGISVSAVLHVVVGAIITLVAGVVGALAGLRTESPVTTQNNCAETPLPDGSSLPESPKSLGKSLSIDPMPLGLLIGGILVGSCAGIYTRTNDWLGPSPHRLAVQWSGSGLAEKDIQRRLFDRLYPPIAAAKPVPDPSAESANDLHSLGVLYGLRSSDCQALQGKRGGELRDKLNLLGRQPVTTIVAKCQEDEVCLDAIREVLCIEKQ